jgi:pimeloyl-ACP methyl ester carboxylesterase
VTVRVALAFVIVITLTGACVPNSPSTAHNSPSIPTPGLVRWSDCGKGFQCGAVDVPLDYANPGAGTIAIAVDRKPATDAPHRIGSLLLNPGGPGASGVKYVRDVAASMGNLNRRFDLVGFDPRGIGDSAPVRCLDGPQEDAYNALDGVLDDPQEKQAAIDADKSFVSGCQARSSRVLPFVDTLSAAKDLELLRIALGDAKLTYLGFSYGSFLGETYAHLYPTHIRAMALDGVVNPNMDPNDMLYDQVVSFEVNLQAFLANCRARRTANPPCAYAKTGDPATKLMSLMEQLDTTPMPVGKRQLTRSLAITGVLGSLYYDPSFWSYLDQALTQMDRGNGAVLLALADLYLARNPDGTYDNESDASWAVNCLDRPVPTDIAAYDQLGPKFAKASALFGPSYQYSNLVCAYWPIKATGKAQTLNAPGAPPILLVGGESDPATPYAWAQAVNQQIAGSVLVKRVGYGHVSYSKSACAKQIEEDYLIDLKVPAAGTVCSN